MKMYENATTFVSEFTGTIDLNIKYPIGVVLLFILTIPAAIILYIVFSIAGYPLY